MSWSIEDKLFNSEKSHLPWAGLGPIQGQKNPNTNKMSNFTTKQYEFQLISHSGPNYIHRSALRSATMEKRIETQRTQLNTEKRKDHIRRMMHRTMHRIDDYVHENHYVNFFVRL